MLSRRSAVFAGLSLPLVHVWIPSVAIAKQNDSLEDTCVHTTKILCDKFGLQSVSQEEYRTLTIPLHRKLESAYSESSDNGFDGPASKVVPAFKSPDNKRFMLTAKHKNHHDYLAMYGSGTESREKPSALPTLAFFQHGQLAQAYGSRYSVEETIRWLFPTEGVRYFDALIGSNILTKPVRVWAKNGYWIMTANDESKGDGKVFAGHGRTTLYNRRGQKMYDYLFEYNLAS